METSKDIVLATNMLQSKTSPEVELMETYTFFSLYSDFLLSSKTSPEVELMETILSIVIT